MRSKRAVYIYTFVLTDFLRMLETLEANCLTMSY
jgi:hypothetical protein